jgi:TonB family protein
MKFSLRAFAVLLSIGALLPVASRAQHTLYKRQGKEWYPVISVLRDHPYLKIGDAIEPSSEGGPTVMRPNETFAPVIIRVENVEAKFMNMRPQSVNHLLKGFTLRAGFVATAPIDGVFMYLAVAMKSGIAQTFFHEIGNLEPGKTKFLSVDHDLAENFDYAGYRIYLFANGAEILNTSMAPEVVDRAMHKMIRQQLGTIQTAGPKPLIAPLPPYPDSLRDKKIQGQAVVSFKVTPEGRATEAAVVSADDPAFGTAALAALNDWWFVPAVKDGTPVATPVRLPFKFAP